MLKRRQKLYAALGDECAALRGGTSLARYDSDYDIQFRYEGMFYYFTGCKEPNCCAIFDGASRKTHLFIPRFNEDSAIWYSAPPSFEDQQSSCDEDMVLHYTDQFEATVRSMQDRRFHVILGIPLLEDLEVPNKVNDFMKIASELRLIKDELEIYCLEKACKVNADAFSYATSHFKPGMKEAEFAGFHAYYCAKMKCHRPSFNPVTAAGKHASVLHYSDCAATAEEGQTFLCDAGCQYELYCSDHTRVIPVGRRFSKKQEQLYLVALECNLEGIRVAKPGVPFEEVHFAVNRKLLEGLRRCGIVRSEYSIEEQMQAGIAFIFQPHGLGHQLGIETHDVGAYNAAIQRSTDFRLKYLRTRRILAPGMVVTIEPGLYFVDGFLNPARANPEQAKHLDFDKIADYQQECGGYRIEDDVLITESGCHVFPGPAKLLDDVYALRDAAFTE